MEGWCRLDDGTILSGSMNQGVHQTDKQDFGECLVWLRKLRQIVCLSEKLQRFVCLSALFAKTSLVLACEGRRCLACGDILLLLTGTMMPHTSPSSYQLRSSCCASARSYNVRGLSLPTELPAIEKVLSFAAALAGIARNSNARCRSSGNLV